MKDYELAESQRIKLDEVIPKTYWRKTKAMFSDAKPKNTMQQFDVD
jgi:hypothetical protein